MAHLQQFKTVQFKTNRSAGCLASIIIPNYNHAAFLRDAIQSVLNQKFRDFEIIVVDDGSTDASREVIAQFGDQVKAIFQANKGLSAARNSGISAARGAYIGLLDADDLLEPDYLHTLVPMLEADLEAAGVYCGYRFVDELNRPLPQIENRLISKCQLHEALTFGNFLVPESVLIRRECYKSPYLFDETLRACEDWDMWLRLSEQYRFIGTTNILTRHRVLPKSMSTNPLRMMNSRLAVLNKLFGEEPDYLGYGDVQVRHAYGRAYLASSVEYLQYGDNESANDCFQKMAEVSPELLTQLDTFYQLGCGDQPKGHLGYFASLDLERNAQVLMNMLGNLFGIKELEDRLNDFKRPAYANAYSALGLLSYGARKFKETRTFLISAVVTDPRYGFRRRLIATGLKSLIDPRILEQIKSKRHKIRV